MATESWKKAVVVHRMRGTTEGEHPTDNCKAEKRKFSVLHEMGKNNPPPLLGVPSALPTAPLRSPNNLQRFVPARNCLRITATASNRVDNQSGNWLSNPSLCPPPPIPHVARTRPVVDGWSLHGTCSSPVSHPHPSAVAPALMAPPTSWPHHAPPWPSLHTPITRTPCDRCGWTARRSCSVPRSPNTCGSSQTSSSRTPCS